MHGAVNAVSALFAGQKDRLLLWIPVFFALGIGFYFSLRFEPPVIASLPFVLSSLSALLLSRTAAETASPMPPDG